jgi:hypothetical protein
VDHADLDYDVFLSFSTSDEESARSLWQHLSASGFRVFWSDTVMRTKLGSAWFDVIQSSLERSRHLVLICSPASLQSEWVRREYTAFFELCSRAPSRKLIPLLSNGVTPRDLPLFLRNIQSSSLEQPGARASLVSALGGGTALERLRSELLSKEEELRQVRAQLVSTTLAPSRTTAAGGGSGSSRRFAGVEEFYAYVADRLGRVHRRIDDTTWGARSQYRTVREQKAYDRYVRTLKRTAAKQSISYREVSSFADIRYVERTRSFLEIPNYNVRYLERRDLNVPLLSFMVVDETEVLFGFYREPVLAVDGEIYAMVESRDIAALFRDYFETLWATAYPIRDGATQNLQMLDEIEKRLREA